MIKNLIMNNKLVEFSQLIARMIPLVVLVAEAVGGIKEVYFDEAAKYNDKIFMSLWVIYFFFFMTEFHYYYMRSRFNGWQNPFNPELGEIYIVRKFREKFYVMMRFFTYIEWYFYKYALIFWVYECIYHYIKAPFRITLINIAVGTFVFPLASLLGRKIMKKFYFDDRGVESNEREKITKNFYVDDLSVETDERENIMSDMSRGKNPVFEIAHIFFRVMPMLFCLSVFEFFFEIAYFDEQIEIEAPLYIYFVAMFLFYFMIEGIYSVLHSGSKAWDNPMNPYLGENPFLRKIREVIYFILRMLIYFERYVFTYIFYFWFIECIYQYVKAPYNISFISFCIGTIAILILGYMGRKMLNSRYFEQ